MENSEFFDNSQFSDSNNNNTSTENCPNKQRQQTTNSISSSQAPQQRKNFSLETKIEAVNRYLQIQNVSQVAREFNCSRSQIRDWCKLQDRIYQTAMSVSASDRKRIISLKPREWWPELEEELFNWYLGEIDNGNSRTITNAVILAEARQLAQRLGINEFKGSEAWVNKFRLRHNIKSKNYRQSTENSEDNLVELNEIFQASDSNDNSLKSTIDLDAKFSLNNTSLNHQSNNLEQQQVQQEQHQNKSDLIGIKLENNNLKFENTNLKYENTLLMNENTNLKSTIEMQSIHIEEIKNQYTLLQQQFKEYLTSNNTNATTNCNK